MVLLTTFTTRLIFVRQSMFWPKLHIKTWHCCPLFQLSCKNEPYYVGSPHHWITHESLIQLPHCHCITTSLHHHITASPFHLNMVWFSPPCYCNSIVAFTTNWKFWCCCIHCLFGVNECQWLVYTHTFPFIPTWYYSKYIYHISADLMYKSWIQGW